MSLSSCLSNSLQNATIANGFCAFPIPIIINRARTVLALEVNRLLVLEEGFNRVVLIEDTDGDTIPDRLRPIATAAGLSHGLARQAGYIYASNDSSVFRWPFLEDPPDIVLTEEDATIVITNMNDDGKGGTPGGHRTRTLVFDDVGRLYISVGSVSNVDDDSFRSRIRRFWLNQSYPINFITGEVFADGVRNEVGLAFDSHGTLWGVNNGPDNLQRNDLGVDIYNDNPGEELNFFAEDAAPGAHYGYPYCWTEYKLPPEVALGVGTQWAWPKTFPQNKIYTDGDCRNSSMFVSPALAMQAHSAPLGIRFYEWQHDSERPVDCSGGFPENMDGYAFVAFHGSWNRVIPTGYKVVYIPMNKSGMVDSDDAIDLLTHRPPNAQWEDGFRPVDLDFDKCGRLYITSDGTRSMGGMGSKIIRIETVPLTSPPAIASNPSTENPHTSNPGSSPEIPSTANRACSSRLTGFIAVLFNFWFIKHN